MELYKFAIFDQYIVIAVSVHYTNVTVSQTYAASQRRHAIASRGKNESL